MISKPLIAAAAVTAALAVAVPAATHAQAPGARTFKLVELNKGSKTTFVDNGRKGAGAGDVVNLVMPVVDDTGAKAGTLTGTCTMSGTPKSDEPPMTCQAVYALSGGDLVVAGRIGPGPDHIAVVGGTGTYAGARGTIDSTDDATGTHDVVTLNAT
jgi:hypothetical protein